MGLTHTVASRPVTFLVSIPAKASGVTVASLVAAGIEALGEDPARAKGWKVLAKDDADADRGVLRYGQAVGALHGLVSAGEELYEPVASLYTTYLGGDAGALADSLIVVYL